MNRYAGNGTGFAQDATDFLDAWNGVPMVEDYGGYKARFAHGVTELACLVHAGRKRFDVHEATGSTPAREALERVGALYTIEAKPRHLAPQLDELKRWLDDLRPEVLGNSGLANAVRYTLKRWSKLTRVLDDGRYPIDYSPIENSIRPIAIGPKNWGFADSQNAVSGPPPL